jgi:hypothetical protein
MISAPKEIANLTPIYPNPPNLQRQLFVRDQLFDKVIELLAD